MHDSRRSALGTRDDARPPTAGAVPKRVLVVRLGAIGDVVNALVVANALKRRDPTIAVGWCVHPLARPLVEGHPSIDRVHVWRRGQGAFELARFVEELREGEYELAIDLQRIAKSALLARSSGAPRVLGFDRERSKEGSWLWTTERIAPSSPRAHMVDQYLEFARHLGLDPTPELDLPRDPTSERWAEATVAPSERAPIVAHVGASKPANRWPSERFGEVARELARAQRRRVFLCGGPGDRELAARALTAAREPAVINLAGETTLRQWIALARRAALVISGDSGPMHLACAVGTRVLALFGSSDPARTGPYGASHRVLRTHPPCAPCLRRDCYQPRHSCMEDLEASAVIEAASAMIARPGDDA